MAVITFHSRGISCRDCRPLETGQADSNVWRDPQRAETTGLAALPKREAALAQQAQM